MGEHALPVAFYGIVDRMPVPVFNHACTVCNVTYGLQAQLSRIRKPWVISGCLGLKYQIIITFYAPCNIAAGGNLAATQTALGRVIYIAACDIHTLGSLVLIDLRLHAVRVIVPFKVEIVSDELVISLVFFDDIGLPCKKVCHELSLEFFVFRIKTHIYGAADIRKGIPVIHTVAPVIKSKLPVKLVNVRKFIFQIFYKFSLCVFGTGVIGLRLIVELEADHAVVVLYLLHELFNDNLCMVQIVRVCDIHVLAVAVELFAVMCYSENIGIFFCKP